MFVYQVEAMKTGPYLKGQLTAATNEGPIGC